MELGILMLDVSEQGSRVPQLVVEAIAEMARQNKKWGKDRKHHPIEWLAILTEEVGEVAKDVVDGTFSGGDAELYRHAAKELIQVAAVAVQAAASIELQFPE